MYNQPQIQYDLALRRRIVQNYIKENNTSPSREQLFELMEQARTKYPDLLSGGFSAYDIVAPYFKKESSSEEYNTNRHAARDDAYVASRNLTEFVRILEDSYRAFLCTINRCMKLNSEVGARLDNLLLLSGRTDVFVHGIEETFDTSEYIDLEKSTVEINPGYVTLGKEHSIKENITGATFYVTTYTPLGKISSTQKYSTLNLLREDGSEWIYTVTTNYPVGTVSVLLEVDLTPINDLGINIQTAKLTGSPRSINSLTGLIVQYSLNGSDYVSLDVTSRSFNKGENLFSIGIEGIRKLRFIFTKTAADYKDDDMYIYEFAVDSLDLSSGSFTRTKESILYAGPYFVTDEASNPVNFSLATLTQNTCCIIPQKTSVSFFLSKDGQTWFPASFTGESLEVVQFGPTTPENPSLIDSDSSSDSLIMDPTKLQSFDVDFRFGKEVFLNTYIPASLSDKFVRQNTYLKRNYRQGTSDIVLYETTSGWFLDKKNLQYSTTLYIEQFEGRTLDLGNTSAFIDGRLVTGEIHLRKGYHTFVTGYSNWYKVSSDLTDTDSLIQNDPRYPFNHKLLIEGYPYPRAFSGERVYRGMGARNFGSLLTYVTPERFNDREFDSDLTIYTIENYNGNLFFKLKADPNDASWKRELVELSYMLRLEESNTLYIKAILRTQDTTITPNINNIQVRVI